MVNGTRFQEDPSPPGPGAQPGRPAEATPIRIGLAARPGGGRRPTVKGPPSRADTEAMEKRQLLWGLGLIAFAFTYIAAVNVTVAGTDFLGNPKAVCGGMWHPIDWFKTCDSALPPRLGVLALGLAVLLVCGYFAEKGQPRFTPGHTNWFYDDKTRTYRCRDCGWRGQNAQAGVAHQRQTRVEIKSQVVRQQPVPNAHGFGASAPTQRPAAIPLAAVADLAGPLTTAPSDYKTCPDCAEQVRAAARKCRFCGYMFEAVSAP